MNMKTGFHYAVFVANKIEIGSKLTTPFIYYSMMISVVQSNYELRAPKVLESDRVHAELSQVYVKGGSVMIVLNGPIWASISGRTL